jgi:hypothetical protein
MVEEVSQAIARYLEPWMHLVCLGLALRLAAVTALVLAVSLGLI